MGNMGAQLMRAPGARTKTDRANHPGPVQTNKVGNRLLAFLFVYHHLLEPLAATFMEPCRGNARGRRHANHNSQIEFLDGMIVKTSR